jgi:hypothetical protein
MPRIALSKLKPDAPAARPQQARPWRVQRAKRALRSVEFQADRTGGPARADPHDKHSS